MADSENRNNAYKERKAMREALLTCLVPEDIADAVRTLLSIGSDPKVKTSDRISAIRTIFEFAVPKPEKSVDVTTAGERITAGIFIEELEDDKEI